MSWRPLLKATVNSKSFSIYSPLRYELQSALIAACDGLLEVPTAAMAKAATTDKGGKDGGSNTRTGSEPVVDALTQC